MNGQQFGSVDSQDRAFLQDVGGFVIFRLFEIQWEPGCH
jgi:hypothetical protein